MKNSTKFGIITTASTVVVFGAVLAAVGIGATKLSESTKAATATQPVALHQDAAEPTTTPTAAPVASVDQAPAPAATQTTTPAPAQTSGSSSTPTAAPTTPTVPHADLMNAAGIAPADQQSVYNIVFAHGDWAIQGCQCFRGMMNIQSPLIRLGNLNTYVVNRYGTWEAAETQAATGNW